MILKHKEKKWISAVILNSIHKKNELYKLIKDNTND